MKNALLVFTVLYSASFLYTAYLLGITLFVHFANKNLGYQEEYFGDVTNKIYLVLTLLFGFFAAFGWFAYRNPNMPQAIKWLVFIPLALVLAYFLFGITILIFGAGKWN